MYFAKISLAISLAGMLLAAPVRTAATQVQQPAEATAPAAAVAYQQPVETAPVCPREDCPRADCPYAPGTCSGGCAQQRGECPNGAGNGGRGSGHHSGGHGQQRRDGSCRQ